MDIETNQKSTNYNTHYKNVYINKFYYGQELPDWVIQKRKMREYRIQQRKTFIPHLKSINKKTTLYFD